MIRVAVITSYFPTSTQPWAGHSAYQTLRLLAPRCDLRVFYPEPVYPRALRPAGGARPIDRTWNPPGVRVTYIPYPVLPVLSRPFNGFTAAHRLLPHVARFQPDVILNYMVYPDGLAAIRVGRALDIPVMLTAIGSDVNRPSDPVCAWLTRRTLAQPRFLCTVSHDLCRTAVRLGAPAARTRAKLNGCDTGIFHPRDRAECRRELGLPAEAEIILYVGRIDHRKGLLELVEACASLHPTRPGLRCYLMGSGPDQPAVEQSIQTHGAAGFITFAASRPTAEVAVWMSAADLVTLPSYMEGCPNVVLEALSTGSPVVATDVGGIPELMDSTCGRLVPPRDAAALATGLDEVLSQPWDTEAIAAQHSRSWADVASENLLILEWLVTRDIENQPE